VSSTAAGTQGCFIVVTGRSMLSVAPGTHTCLTVVIGRSVLSTAPGTHSCLDCQSLSPYHARTAHTAHCTTVFLLILCKHIIVVIFTHILL